MKQAKLREQARFCIGDRVVYMKFFEYPGRGFEPHERQQIGALSVGERVTIRDHVIERVEDKKEDTSSEAFGMFAGVMVFIGLAFWLIRTAWHAISAHGWMYAVSQKLSAVFNGIVMGAIGDAMGAAVKINESPSPFLMLTLLLMILGMCLAISAATAFAAGELTSRVVYEQFDGGRFQAASFC